MKFKQSISEFASSKTNQLGITMIVGGVIAFMYENMTQFEAGQMVVGGMFMLFSKDSIAGMKNDKST